MSEQEKKSKPEKIPEIGVSSEDFKVIAKSQITLPKREMPVILNEATKEGVIIKALNPLDLGRLYEKYPELEKDRTLFTLALIKESIVEPKLESIEEVKQFKIDYFNKILGAIMELSGFTIPGVRREISFR